MKISFYRQNDKNFRPPSLKLTSQWSLKHSALYLPHPLYHQNSSALATQFAQAGLAQLQGRTMVKKASFVTLTTSKINYHTATACHLFPVCTIVPGIRDLEKIVPGIRDLDPPYPPPLL